MPDFTLDTVQLADVYLDNDNPRHDPIDAEPDIIARLVAHEKVEKLAGSIAERGPSPLERMAVIRHPRIKGKYTVVEGNRRLCSLKLLRDPQRAPNAQSRKAFEDLRAAGQAIPTKLDVAVFKDRDSARYWLSLRHEGQQDGIGTRNWNAPEKARFNAQQSPTSNPNKQALALIDYAEQAGLVSPGERQEVSISTVTRYLSNPVVRSTLGLSNNKDLTIDVPQAAFDGIVKQFLDDTLTGVAHSRSKSDDRKKYANSLIAAGIAPTERTDQPSIAVPAKAAVVTKKVAPRSSRHPDKRRYIVPSGYVVKSKEPILRRVFEELRKIEPDEFKFAAGFLLRAFIEKVAFTYAKQNGIGTNGKLLHSVILLCCQHLEDAGTPVRALKALRVAANNADHPASPDTLGASVHGALIPDSNGLKARWDELSPGLTLMLERLK
ncbi:hypothetical protein [Xanthomonas arboricola]|uniref:hypothetical protein n=1 Tax=Xanthomonas arboricola TaxID=56448 RepID=UPI0011B0583C|nr:hypothetical protein [Xanthomonas arboricola]